MVFRASDLRRCFSYLHALPLYLLCVNCYERRTIQVRREGVRAIHRARDTTQRHSREGGNPVKRVSDCGVDLDARLRGHDGRENACDCAMLLLNCDRSSYFLHLSLSEATRLAKTPLMISDFNSA